MLVSLQVSVSEVCDKTVWRCTDLEVNPDLTQYPLRNVCYSSCSRTGRSKTPVNRATNK